MVSSLRKFGCRLRVCVLALLFGGLSVALAAASPGFELFAMDNGVGRGRWSPTEQAAALREFGYHGISYNYTDADALASWLAALKAADLRLVGLYFPSRVGDDRIAPPGLERAVELLRGNGAALWLTLPNPTRPDDYEADALRRIRAIADLAATANLRVVLYPHKGFYLATAEHAYALALKAQRANVGVTVNLAHELAAGNGMRLPEIIRSVAPLLKLVTINGATDRPAGGWESLIQLLGKGDYDVAALLSTLAAVRYDGPVGLQFYNVPGDTRENLAASMQAWRSFRLTPQR
jgi:sugar phosphate isomerase/epimerase